MIGTSQLINAFSRPCFTDTTDIFKDGSGVALYGLDYDASDTGGASGKFGEAAIFNGSSSNISIPTLGGSFYDNDFSISLWVNLNSLGGGSTAYLFSGAGSRDVFINFNSGNSGGGISARLYDGTIRDVVYSSAVAGNWYHVVFVRSKTNGLNLYVDGVSRDTNSFTGNAQALSFTSDGIGGRVQDRNTTDGRIDQVRIFNTALTSSQVTQLYQENNSTVGTHLFGCIANYNLDGNAKESMGTTAYDGTETDITYRYDGTPTAVDFGVGGKSNYGARFNGTSSFVNTNYTLTIDTTFSFSWWMNADSPTTNHYIFNDGNGTGHDGSLAIYHNTSGQLGMWIGANGSGYAYGLLTITGGLSGSWMHFAVSVNGSTATVYKNGSSAGTISLTPHSTAGILTLIIGRLGHFNGYYFKGDLDQIRYFNKAISATEVGTLYAETACVYTANTTNNNYPTTNLAYYKLDNSAEDEKGSYDGTESNIEYRFGRFGQAAVFNGSSSIITATQPSGLNGPCTYSAWLKTTSSSYQSIITVGSVTGSHTAGVNLFVNSGKLSCQTGNGSNTENSSVNSTSDINTGNWVHCAVVVAGSTQGSSIKVYVNGQEEGSGTANNTAIVAASSESLCLGGRILSGSQSTFLNGSLDQVRIFSSALSADQITQLYNEKPEVDTSNFKAVLYEGNGGTNFISNVGFQPDLVWAKARDGAHDHVLYDTVRSVGSGKALSSNATYAQGAYDAAYGFLDTFEATGFVAKTGSSFANYTNKNNESYVAWCWKAGGDAVNIGVNSITGSTPSIASDVSANTAAGFSIVKVNSHNNTQTIGHGLSQAPEVIFQKTLNSSSYGWYVYHKDVGNDKYLQLNTTAAAVSDNFWNYTTPTDSVFTHRFSTSSFNMIFYCWHSVANYSKIGSYTGNGNATGPIVTTGFEPSWIMIKNTTTATAWLIFDSARNPTNSRYNLLQPQDSAAEIDLLNLYSLEGVDFLSTGFQIKDTNGSRNALNDNYIYMAFK